MPLKKSTPLRSDSQRVSSQVHMGILNQCVEEKGRSFFIALTIYNQEVLQGCVCGITSRYDRAWDLVVASQVCFLSFTESKQIPDLLKA